MSETIDYEENAINDTHETSSEKLTTLTSVNFTTLNLEPAEASQNSIDHDDAIEKENVETSPQLPQQPDESTKSTSKRKGPKSKRKVHACSLCAYKTTKNMLLQRHLSVHDTDKPFKCEHCDRSFRDPVQLANHTNIHMGTKPFKCTECELGFTTRGEMIRHTKYKHSNEKPHKCPHCEYASVELSKLKRHMRIHTGERPYLCPHCDYASRDTFKLKRHIRTHTGEKPYECPVCGSRFTQSNSLKTHLQIHREAERTSTKCDLCDMDLENLFALAEHIKLKHSHNDATSADVSIINSIFDRQPANTTKDSLDNNDATMQKSDTSPNVFSCSECAVRFTSREALESHKVKHTGERPFQCMICGIFFGQLFALRAHLESHEKSDAKKRQKSKSPSRKKDISGSEEQPSVSSDKENSRSLNDTQVDVNKARETFSCVFCTSKLVNKVNLQRHMKKKHNFDINIEEIDGFMRVGRIPESANKQISDSSNVEALSNGTVNLGQTPKSALKRAKKSSDVKTPQATKRIKFEQSTPSTGLVSAVSVDAGDTQQQQTTS